MTSMCNIIDDPDQDGLDKISAKSLQTSLRLRNACLLESHSKFALGTYMQRKYETLQF